MSVGEKLRFKKFNWVITRKIEYPSGDVEYRYRVQRKYFKGFVPLYYTEQDYPIRFWRWDFLKRKLKTNPDYHFNMALWSNRTRT